MIANLFKFDYWINKDQKFKLYLKIKVKPKILEIDNVKEYFKHINSLYY